MTLPIVTIEKLAFGGNGITKIDGKVCFVPFSCPGDVLSVKITTNKKSYCTALIVEILTASPLRTNPHCAVFGRCGGCNWQHINYITQSAQKHKILAETLWRGARVDAELVENVVESPLQYAYRSRFQFKVALSNGKLSIGFYRQGSHHVENIPDGCPIAMPVINQVLKKIRELLQDYQNLASISGLDIDAGEKNLILILHHFGKITQKELAFLTDCAQKIPECTGFFIKSNTDKKHRLLLGSSEISYLMPQIKSDVQPLKLIYPTGGFAQVNSTQNSAMLNVIKELGAFQKSEKLLDLYCGNGNFTLPLTSYVSSVVGVEVNKESVDAAEQNKKNNDITNAIFFCHDVSAAVRNFIAENQFFDTVLLDPPRSGVGESIVDIVQLKPSKIIYVSCDPSTVARDCGFLADFGYVVVKSVPIDMFPQTFHIESITLLLRKKG